MTPVPNFFIVGAPKAGTTSLYHYLRQHPDIYMSPMKEPQFFISEFRPERLNRAWRRGIEANARRFAAYLDNPTAGERPPGIVTSWEQYLKLFRGVGRQRAIGEASIGCLWSRTAAQDIATRIPGARIIMILRHPTDRAFSQYLHAATRDQATIPFSELIRRPSEGGEISALTPLLEFGAYFRQVERFLSRFPPPQVGIYLYDDYVRDADGMIRAMLRLLDVQSDVALDLSQRHFEPRVPRFATIERWLRPARRFLATIVPRGVRRLPDRLRYVPRTSLTMAPADRRFLIEFYEQDVRQLSQLIDRDLSAWLK